MNYTIEKANRIAEQLRKFTTGYAHHVAGQFSNLDFWLDEVKTAQITIDEYKPRFYNIRNTQREWVEEHGTVVFDYCPRCGGKCQLSIGKPLTPNMMSNKMLKKARVELVNSTYYFLTRCYRQGLLNEKGLKQKCDFIGTSIDPQDLEKKNE